MPTLIPRLRVKDTAEAIDFYQRAFGAVELSRLTLQDGSIVNVELKIGEAEFQLTEESPDDPHFHSPTILGGTSIIVDLVVDNVDAVTKQALAAGAIEQYPVTDHFYGWRQGRVVDPFGHLWTIGTKIEDLSNAEIQRRMDEMVG